MNIIVTHPTGNSNVRAILNMLEKNNDLYRFITSLSFQEGSKLLKYLPSGISKELSRRSYPETRGKSLTVPFREAIRLLALKFNIQSLIKHEKGWACIDKVYISCDQFAGRYIEQVSRKERIDAVYNYEDCAVNTFQKARKSEIACIYDLPIAYWETAKKLLQEEVTRLPEWAKTLGGGIADSAEKLDRKATELELADMVVTPSSFVKDSLPYWAKNKKCIVAPFGSPTGPFYKDEQKIESRRPIRILFVGSMGQRKGLGDLAEAFRRLRRSDIQLVILGSPLAPMEFYWSQFGGCNVVFEKGRSHDDVLRLMATCDVFCLPSIVEGRALVVQEAMSQGLPIIITSNTGCSDLVEEGVNGFLIPIRAPEILAEKINWFADNRDHVILMGINARNTSLRYTWDAYGNSVLDALRVLRP